MSLTSSEMLTQLGAGAPIAAVCSAAGISREQFDAWWRQEIAARVPGQSGACRAAVKHRVRIERDESGIPHIHAESDEDLFFGFGYAMAQDRLFQLDYLRRRAYGRLSEILGPSGLESDLVARTIGLGQIAAAEWDRMPLETRQLVSAFSAGVNAVIAESRSKLPIEFDLLGYVPEPWQPEDSLAVEGEFRWYLTGRFPVIAIPELAKRALGDGALYQAFLQAEFDDESILPPGSYPTIPKAAAARTGGAPDDGSGSNNWVVSGARTTTGKPLLASDPHIAFAAVSCWYEVHLQGGSFNVTGITYAGMPAVMFGRNSHVAWGITNNICSLRDLYQERTDPAHPGCFFYDGRWEPGRERVEVIHVKGADSVRKTIVSSRNGPLVDEILPGPARDTGPVSVRWLGSENCGWLTALLNMDRARSGGELRAATEPWLVPTFCVVFADVAGRIGYQCTGRIPIRRKAERGYRQGWNPDHQWDGVIPFEAMPHLLDPARGWIITANNRIAADDFAYPLSGTWSNGQRAARIRQMIEQQPRHAPADFVRMQQDAVSLRAADCVPRLLAVLERQTDPRIHQAVNHLAGWDFRMEPDRVAASIFSMFFAHWSRAIAQERFEGDAITLVAGAIGGLATTLLSGDPAGWFVRGAREATLVAAFNSALDALTEQFGGEMLDWAWGRMHKMIQKHFLSDRGELGALLDRGGIPVKGDGVTVCNTGFDPNWGATMGAGYRLIADLSDPHGTLRAVDAGSESGHPGSPHYDDQLTVWLTGRYHDLALTPDREPKRPARLLLEPA